MDSSMAQLLEPCVPTPAQITFLVGKDCHRLKVSTIGREGTDKVHLTEGIEVAQKLCQSIIPSLNDSRQTEIVAIIAVMTVVSTISVILRLLGRRVSAAKYGVDDFLIVVALVLTYGLNINEIIAVHYGFGRHQLMLSLNYISKFLLNDWTIQIIFACAISVTRLSLLMFYHRIFPVKRFTIVAIITGCILIAWWISFIFAILFSCYPIESYWNKALIGHCVNEHTLSWGVTGSELATNLIMLVLPIPWLWDLRLVWTKKLALIGLFMLGCFVCISCVVRFPLLATLVQTDASWTIVPAGVWIIVECNIGIASVCLPLMRPLFSLDRSRLSTHLPFSKARRTPSPFTFTDEEEAGGGLPSFGKLCNEKPYDGPCPDLTHHPRNNYRHISSQYQNHPPKPVHGRGRYSDVQTHRSRIESYSPDQLAQMDAAKARLSSTSKTHRASTTTTQPKLPSSAQPPPGSTTRPKPLSTNLPPAKPPPIATPATRPKPLSMNPPPHKPLPALIPTLYDTKRKTYPATAKPLSMNPPPPKPRPSSTIKAKPPLTLATTKPLPSRSARATHPLPPPHPPITTTPRHARRKTYRLSEEEMSERYAKWYQGRGSEIGKGLWGLEIVSPGNGGGGGGGGGGRIGLKGCDVPWEIGDRGKICQIGPPKSRLSS
ncbi:MAG: hypothetical protein L6R40_002848 [Gallowayella cf. fulva]|nr:MAG: hypothetical protein L6R40_002848 [Xanthomendoza cf. fulva]